MSQQDVRAAAENLLRSNEIQRSYSAHSVANISQSHSVNTVTSIRPECVLTDAYFAGLRHNGRMSYIRRFFCMFVTFDLLFTALMWLICIMLNGDNIMTALKKQIYHYDIHTSLFDVVVVAICRFLVLIMFYALVYINHWIVIALSTSLTCAFLVAKVFIYDVSYYQGTCYKWQASNQPVFHVLLILISFVLSWGESWFLDFRVIPQEFNARQYLITSPDSERAPLVRNYVQSLPSMYTESVGNFYSPLGSPEGSLHGFETVDYPRRYPPVRLTVEEEINYRSLGTNALAESWGLLNSPNWKTTKRSHNDFVDTMTLPKVGKIYRLTASLKIAPRYLLQELYYNVEKMPQWNPALMESYRVQTLDENTDISYQVSTEAAGGMVTSREFVLLRHWDIVENCFVIACKSTTHPSLPKNTKLIRGENGAGCFSMRELPDDPESCEFRWLLNTNLKGWIPQYILEQAFVTMMFDYLKHLRKYTNTLRPTFGQPL